MLHKVRKPNSTIICPSWIQPGPKAPKQSITFHVENEVAIGVVHTYTTCMVYTHQSALDSDQYLYMNVNNECDNQ